MMARIRGTVMAAVLALAVAGLLSPAPAAAEIRFGTLPRFSATELQTMFAPLADYLARETGEKVTLVIPKDFDAFRDEVKAGHMDVGFANPLIYVQAKEKTNIEPLAQIGRASCRERVSNNV
jgi:ABC-type phosphate/phosphonate transport system substrate-binding protein